MEPALTRQQVLPLWLLRGFARGDGEAAETTWCYTPAAVRATKLADAGAGTEGDDAMGQDIAKALAQWDADADASRDGDLAQALRAREPGPIDDPTPALAELVIALAVRVFCVRNTIERAESSMLHDALMLARTVDDPTPEMKQLFAEMDEMGDEEEAAHNPPGAGPPSRAADLTPAQNRARNEAQCAASRRRADDLFAANVDRLAEWMSGARFHLVGFPPDSLILGDAITLSWNVAERIMSTFEIMDTEPTPLVCVPLAADRLLVATRDCDIDPYALPAPVLNFESASWAQSFFVAAVNRPDFSKLRPRILSAPGAQEEPDDLAEDQSAGA